MVYFICHWGQILWSYLYSVLEPFIFSVYITSWVVSFICIPLNITYILMTPKYNFLAWPSPLNFSPVYLWLPTQHLGYQIDIWKLTCLLTYLSKSTLSIPLNDTSIFLVRLKDVKSSLKSPFLPYPKSNPAINHLWFYHLPPTLLSPGTNNLDLHYAKSHLNFLIMHFHTYCLFLHSTGNVPLNHKLDHIT